MSGPSPCRSSHRGGDEMIDWSHLKKAATGLQSCPEEYAMCGATVRQISGDILALLDELESCKADAERYRLYRSGFESPETFDANIDAAMAMDDCAKEYDGWRTHSVNYAKGEKPPETIETLQAAWDRDQELLLEQKDEISRLKQKLNQARQKLGVVIVDGENG